MKDDVSKTGKKKEKKGGSKEQEYKVNRPHSSIETRDEKGGDGGRQTIGSMLMRLHSYDKLDGEQTRSFFLSKKKKKEKVTSTLLPTATLFSKRLIRPRV